MSQINVMGAANCKMMPIINRIFLRRELLLVCCLVWLGVNLPGVNAANGKVKILFFYSRTCSDCHSIEHEFLPKIIAKYQNQLEMKCFEITAIENFKLLINLEKSLQREINKTPPLMIIEDDVLEGDSAIQARLEQTINKYLKIKK